MGCRVCPVPPSPGGPPAGAPGGVPGGAPAGATMSWTLKAEDWELKTINHDDMKLRTKDSGYSDAKLRTDD